MSWDDEDFEVKAPPGCVLRGACLRSFLPATPLPLALSSCSVAEPPASWEDEVDKTLAEEAPEPTTTGPAAPVIFKAKHVRGLRRCVLCPPAGLPRTLKPIATCGLLRRGPRGMSHR